MQRDELRVLLYNLEASVEDKIAKTASESDVNSSDKARHDVEKRHVMTQLNKADSRAESVTEAEKKVDEYKTKFEIERGAHCCYGA